MTASRVIPILTLSYMIGSTVALGSIMCKGINIALLVNMRHVAMYIHARMVTLLAEQIVNERLCHAGRVYQ